MKIYTKTIFVFFLLFPLKSFSASYTDIFEQFKQSNSEYKNFELSPQFNDEKSAVADRADLDADGYDDIIFVMQKQGIEKTDKQVVPKRLVVLKGQAQGKFKTLLVNQKIAEFDNGQGCYLTVKADVKYKPPSFNVRVNCGYTMNPRIPANRYNFDFGLEGEKLPVHTVAYESPWLRESAMPPYDYFYSFTDQKYGRSWSKFVEEVEVGFSTSGEFKVTTDTGRVYMESTTDPFKASKDNRGAAIVFDNIIITSESHEES